MDMNISTPDTDRGVAPTMVLRPGVMHGPAAMQALGLARFADDPGAQGAAPQDTTQDGPGSGQGTNPPSDGQQAGPAQSQKALAGRGDDWRMSDLPGRVQRH